MLPLDSSTRPEEPSTCLRSSVNFTGFGSHSGLSSILPCSPSAALTVQRRSISLMGYSELPTSARALGCALGRRRYFTFHGRITQQSVIGPSSDLPHRCREGLEQSAAVDNVVAPVQKGAEDGIFPTIRRRRSPLHGL